MNFRAVEAAEWDRIHSVDTYAKQIRERATLLLETLAKQYSQSVDGENHGVRFSLTGEKGVVGYVESDLGDGRFTFSFGFAERILIGKLQVERRITGRSEHVEWEPVWGIIVPVQGDIFVGAAPRRFVIPSANGVHKDRRAAAIYEFGQIILYSLVAGPFLE